MRAEPWPFVGRQGEVAECLDLIDAGRSVLLSAPAGIGKTQLAREIADRCEQRRRVIRLVASFSTAVPVLNLVGAEGVPLIVVDDLHLLDGDAAAVIGSMVVDGDLVLLGTMRAGAPAPAALTTLWKDDHAVRIDLAPLTRAQLDEVLASVIPGPIDSSTRRRLWELTRGSPLFLRELMRSSIDDGSLVQRDAMWRLIRPPRSARLDELIGGRLDALPHPVRDAVELIALGEPVPFEALLSAVGPAVLDEAERSGLVEVVIDELRRDVRLAHPAFGDIARRQVGATRSALHCARLLGMIESTAMRRRDDIVQAATWQLRAGGQVVTDDMVLAARRALYDRNEWLAIELASRAAGDRRADAVLVLSQAFTELGQPERAERLLRELGGDLDAIDRALVAIQRAVVTFWGLGDASAAERVLVDVEASLPPGPWSDEVRAERAVLAATQGDFRRALDIAGPLLSPTNAPRVFVTAAIAGAVSMSLDGHSVDAADLAEAAFAIGSGLTPEQGMSDPSIHLVARALALSESGELGLSEELARFAHAVSIDDGVRHGQAWFALTLGRTLLIRGRPTEAQALFEESAAAFAWLHSAGPRRWALAGVVQASAAVGDAETAERVWGELAAVSEHPARMMAIEVDRAEGWLLAARGDVDAAIARLSCIADVAFACDSISLGGAVLHDIVRLGGVTGHPGLDRLAVAQGRLAPLRAAYIHATAAMDATGVESAGAGFGELGADQYAAEAYQRAGDLHDRDRSPRSATRCRSSAREMQRRTGEEWLLTLGTAGHRVVARVAPPGMTSREREIAVLAAGGCTNREIAEQLFVSVRTVENHLQHVYDKLGIGSRRELASALGSS